MSMTWIPLIFRVVVARLEGSKFCTTFRFSGEVNPGPMSMFCDMGRGLPVLLVGSVAWLAFGSWGVMVEEFGNSLWLLAVLLVDVLVVVVMSLVVEGSLVDVWFSGAVLVVGDAVAPVAVAVVGSIVCCVPVDDDGIAESWGCWLVASSSFSMSPYGSP